MYSPAFFASAGKPNSPTNKGESQARAVSVDSRAILEALARVYKADSLVGELVSGKSRD